MRVATGIIGLVFTVVIGIYGLLYFLGASIGSSTAGAYAGILTMLISMLFLVASAFAFKMPHVSRNLFFTAAMVAIGAAMLLNLWLGICAAVAFVLCWMSGRAVESEEVSI
ncbi:hypothetical protein [Paenibacillus sp. KN14-4R]|uniref:hypothetical protein n=1 Tax=Paenibacillus sp. KN14-4R TaxID=3445773 RepID=UPI003FA0EFFE